MPCRQNPTTLQNDPCYEKEPTIINGQTFRMNFSWNPPDYLTLIIAAIEVDNVTHEEKRTAIADFENSKRCDSAEDTLPYCEEAIPPTAQYTFYRFGGEAFLRWCKLPNGSMMQITVSHTAPVTALRPTSSNQLKLSNLV